MFAPENNSGINKVRTQTESVPVCIECFCSRSEISSWRCVTAGRAEAAIKVHGVSCLSESHRAHRSTSNAWRKTHTQTGLSEHVFLMVLTTCADQQSLQSLIRTVTAQHPLTLHSKLKSSSHNKKKHQDHQLMSRLLLLQTLFSVTQQGNVHFSVLTGKCANSWTCLQAIGKNIHVSGSCYS